MLEQHQVLARRIVRTLFIAQSLGSAGFIASSTVSAIVASSLSGGSTWAGLPSATYQVGAALAAVAWGYASDRLGRRGSLVLGMFIGIIGAGFASVSVVASAFGVLLLGSLCMGAAQSGLQLGRFAAAEVNLPASRGRAISNVVVGGTIGSVLGPLLVGPMGRLARGVGVDELAGPYVASMILFALAMLVIWQWLRPDPRDLGRELAQHLAEQSTDDFAARPLGVILRLPGAQLAMSAMIFGQLTMVMVMVMTSVHMHDHHHALPSISFVISSHTFGMFAFSILSGQLVDRWGRVPVIMFGASALILACALAPLSPNVIPLAVALFILGLGWNFCFVGGSSLLSDQLRPAERARTQGTNDLLIGIVSACGSLGSGFAFAAFGYAAMAMVGAAFALIPLVAAGWLGKRVQPALSV